MFEARVAQFYRSKGYEVHENPRVRGSSENVYAVPLVAEGPLGALLISFGDAGGIDAHELGRVRTMARDIGATPVLASESLSTDLRRLAAQMGVVVVDGPTVLEQGPLPREMPSVAANDPLRRALEAHPWPASGRAYAPAGPVAAVARDVDELVQELHQPRTVQVLAPPAPTPAPATKFAWLTPASEPVDLGAILGKQDAPALEQETDLVARTNVERVRESALDIYDTARDWPWKTILAAGVGAVVLFQIIRWAAP